jgi:hypothetical protein
MPPSPPRNLPISLVTDVGADCVDPALAVGFKGVVGEVLF